MRRIHLVGLLVAVASLMLHGEALAQLVSSERVDTNDMEVYISAHAGPTGSEVVNTETDSDPTYAEEDATATYVDPFTGATSYSIGEAEAECLTSQGSTSTTPEVTVECDGAATNTGPTYPRAYAETVATAITDWEPSDDGVLSGSIYLYDIVTYGPLHTNKCIQVVCGDSSINAMYLGSGNWWISATLQQIDNYGNQYQQTINDWSWGDLDDTFTFEQYATGGETYRLSAHIYLDPIATSSQYQSSTHSVYANAWFQVQ